MREEGGEEIATGSVTTRATDPSSSIKSQTKISSCVAHRAHTVAKPKADEDMCCRSRRRHEDDALFHRIALRSLHCVLFVLF